MNSIRLAYLTNAPTNSGVGYRAHKMRQYLTAYSSQLSVTDFVVGRASGAVPVRSLALPKTLSWIRQGRALQRTFDQPANFNVIHATNQSLSFILPHQAATVVTVHDLIEYLEPQTFFGKLLAYYLYSGIRRANHIIAVSNFTKQSIVETYGIPAASITVIPNGVDEDFHVIDNFTSSVGAHVLRQQLKLAPNARIILSVGSDHPRKNAIGALRAFYEVHRKIPQAIFLKVGEPGLAAGRAALLAEIDRLKLKGAVRLMGNVSLEKLNDFYNAADVLVYPSFFEGFGLPVLQAMAAGLPVLTSKATAIPEVAGEAAVMQDPHDTQALASALQRLLEDEHHRREYILRGLRQAQRFSWATAAELEMLVYQTVSTSHV